MLRYPAFWHGRSLINYLLLPFSMIYSALGVLRRLFAKPIKFNMPVICIGNPTVGGTGKTQLVIWLAKYFEQQGIDYYIVSKGYGGFCKKAVIVDIALYNAKIIGDEAFMMAKRGLKVIVAPNPVEALDILMDLQPKVVIFDDGMQNPHFHKDLTIMTIDGMRGFGNEMILPAGPMRSSIKTAIAKSDIAIIVGDDKKNVASKLPLPTIFANIAVEADYNKKQQYYAFAAIGNPEKFFTLLEDSGYIVKHKEGFPDHYNYSHEEIVNLINNAEKKGLKLITTSKDYYKIPVQYRNRIICFEVKLDVAHAQKLINIIDERILHKN